jgi:formate hydrogenlyase subunit 6/NADH:ubiquinone oxidoreductase subunit I
MLLTESLFKQEESLSFRASVENLEGLRAHLEDMRAQDNMHEHGYGHSLGRCVWCVWCVCVCINIFIYDVYMY